MEETLNKLKVTYIGNIHDVAYFNVEYSDGFGPNTTVKVADTCTCCFLESELVGNCAKYGDKTLKTLMIPKQSEAITNIEYTIKLYEGDTLVEEANVISDPSDVPALIKENVNVKSIGDRIIEIVFDEPVRHLESTFDFAADRFNRVSPPALTDKMNYIFYDGTKYYTINSLGSFEIDVEGKELSTPYTPIVPTNSKLVFIDINAMSTNIPSISLPLTPVNTLTKITNGIKANQSAYVRYFSEYSKESHKDSAVLINYYFRYFGTDDEGTLYEPKDKPIDWLGYFAGHDITTRISSDNRKLEIQFDAYSLPTASVEQGDVPHQLIINYAKTFPNYSGQYRIVDANNNPFPIIRESVEFIKDSVKAKVTDVVALSKDEVLVYFDKPVLCHSFDGDTDDVHYQILTINDITPESVERYDNTYNVLHCYLNTSDALAVGSVEVTIGSIIDACGYHTVPYTKTIEVVAVPPKVISLKQSENGIDGEETILDIVFSDPMSIIDSDASAYFKIYKIENDIKELITPESITKIYQNDDVLQVLIKPALEPGGLYEVHIFDLTNIYETVMEYYKGLLHIKDMSEPFITAIYLTDNTKYTDPTEQYKIAILFNETMENTGIHALENRENYLIYTPIDITKPLEQCSDNSVKTPLSHDNCEKAISIKNNKAVRIILNKDEIPTTDNSGDPLDFKPEHIIVKAGYCSLDEVMYLINTAGNVLDFVCPKEEVLSNPITLTNNATFEVIDNKTVVMTYEALNNEILTADKLAFSLISPNSTDKIMATNVVVGSVSDLTSQANNKIGTVTITFPAGSFDDSGKSINVTDTCDDIFGNKVIGLTNPVALNYNPVPRLVNAYLSAIHSDSVIFALEFNEVVKLLGTSKLAGRDYSVSVNNGHYRAATAIGSLVGASDFDGMYVQLPKGDRQILFLQYDNLNDEVFDKNDEFKISVNVPSIAFKTVDATTQKPVEVFADKVINKTLPPSNETLKVSKFTVTPTSPGVLATLEFTISTESTIAIDALTREIDNLDCILANDKKSLKENSLFKYVKFTTISDLPVLELSYKFTAGSLVVTFSSINSLDDITGLEFDLRDALITVKGIPVINEALTSVKNS
ncbi:MAG: hypothetical protein ACRDCW_12580 [Sarcina sp.]